MENIIIAAGSILFSIIGFFLRGVITDLKEIKKITYKNENEISVMKNDYNLKIDFLSNKFDELNNNIKALTLELKNFTKEIHIKLENKINKDDKN